MKTLTLYLSTESFQPNRKASPPRGGVRAEVVLPGADQIFHGGDAGNGATYGAEKG